MNSIPAMERETELTQSWSPELAALSDKGGLLKGIPLQIGGEMRTFSLPMPQDDDGTDISLKDWQLGPRNNAILDRETTAAYSIKPFKGSVRTRFTPVEARLDEGGQSSPEYFDTPTTPRTPRTSSSCGTRSSSVSPSKSFLQETADPTPLQQNQNEDSNNNDDDDNADAQTTTPAPHPPGIAFDIASKDQTLTEATSTLRARSLRVSFKKSSNSQRPSCPPIVRHRSPLKSRSILPSKEAKSLQPKWESSTKIRPTSSTSSFSSKPHVQAPLHGMKARKGTSAANNKRARAVIVAPEIEPEPEFQSSSGYMSEGRYLSSARLYDVRRSLDSQSMAHERFVDEHGSNRLSRELTMSGGDSDDDEDVKGGMMLCGGGGLSDTKLSGDFVRLLSKLCRVSVPSPKQQQPAVSKSAQQRGRKLDRSNPTSLSWDPSTTRDAISVLGRHDSLKLLSERCSTAPAPSYNLHDKPRKIRNHEPHQHFYRTISKTLDQKLKS